MTSPGGVVKSVLVALCVVCLVQTVCSAPTVQLTRSVHTLSTRHRQLHQFPGYMEDELQFPNYTRPRPWQINMNVCPPSLCPKLTRKPMRSGQPTAIVTAMPPAGGTLMPPEISVEHVQDFHEQERFPFFEADIVLDDGLHHIHPEIFHAQQVRRGHRPPHSSSSSRRRRATVKQNSRRWPDAVVPYELDDELPAETKQSIENAFRHFANYTCIRFRPKTDSDVDFVVFVFQPGCWSQVGRAGGKQLISFGEGCELFGTVVHEMTHALGFWHEQSRPDRDNYIDVLWDNLEPDAFDQFNARTDNESTSHGYMYDYHSITHYGDNYYSMSLEPTIQVTGIGRKFNMSIGQRKKLSSIDIAQLNEMYSCFSKDAQKHSCETGWVKYRLYCFLFVSNESQQFYSAARTCRSKRRGQLAALNNWRKDAFVKSYLSANFPDIESWRTSGLLQRSSFPSGVGVWYTLGTHGRHPNMTYTAWTNQSTPVTSRGEQLANQSRAGDVSVVLRRSADVSSSEVKFEWSVENTGSAKAPDKHQLPFVCEAKSKMPCFNSVTGFGRDYRGSLNYTTERAMCQRWTRRYPHNHTLITGNPALDDLEGLGAHNFCRNPHGLHRRPWCFTLLKAVTWQYCDVSVCHVTRL